jgi:hypothetical protein
MTAFALSGIIESARKRLDAVGICVVAGLAGRGRLNATLNPEPAWHAAATTARHRAYAARSRSALPTTDTELNAIAAAAMSGESSMPVKG